MGEGERDRQTQTDRDEQTNRQKNGRTERHTKTSLRIISFLVFVVVVITVMNTMNVIMYHRLNAIILIGLILFSTKPCLLSCTTESLDNIQKTKRLCGEEEQ